MKKYRKYAVLTGLLIWSFNGILGQYITASVDTTHHLIGDHVHLYVRADVSEQSDILHTDLSAIDTSGYEVVNKGEWQKTKQGRMHYFLRDIVLTRFDSGYFRIPPVEVRIHLPEGKEITERTPWIPVLFDIPRLPTPKPIPIKDIYEEPSTWRDYIQYFLWLAGLILVYLIYRWYKHRSQEVEVIPAPEIPPVKEALEALDTLEQEALWQKGQVKAHYSHLSEILRRYLERKYHFPALEWTKREIHRYIIKKGVSNFPLGQVDELLRISDLVKFAKYQPEEHRHSEVVGETKALIKHMDNIALDPVITEIKEEEE